MLETFLREERLRIRFGAKGLIEELDVKPRGNGRRTGTHALISILLLLNRPKVVGSPVFNAAPRWQTHSQVDVP